MSGKIEHNGDVYSVNEDFQQDVLLFADEIEIDELEAARCLFDSQQDPSILGRSLLECAIIRFHQQRKYALDAVRLLLELNGVEEEAEESLTLESIQVYVAGRLFRSGSKARLVPRCMSAMASIKTWLQRLGDKLAAAQTRGLAGPDGMSEEVETVEFARASLIQQHELLAVIMSRSIEKRQGDSSDFANFIATLKKADRYDTLLGQSPVQNP